MTSATIATPASLPHGSADRNQLGRSLVSSDIVAPSRERGSKRLGHPAMRSLSRRSLTGARIETRVGADFLGAGRGRSLTGARIETSSQPQPARQALVAPSRERGSKHLWRGNLMEPEDGRSLTGARIETSSAPRWHRRRRVAPSRERGSKRVRADHRRRNPRRRSLTGARIETCPTTKLRDWHSVAPSRERGSKRQVEAVERVR